MPDLLMSELKDSAEYFATHYLASESLVDAYRAHSGDEEGFAESFQLPRAVAEDRW